MSQKNKNLYIQNFEKGNPEDVVKKKNLTFSIYGNVTIGKKGKKRKGKGRKKRAQIHIGSSKYK